MATQPLAENRTCCKCGIEKPHDREHFVLKLGKLTPLCRECSKADCKRRYEANREKRKAENRARWHANKDRYRVAQRRYYREHLDERKAADKAYREANREKRREAHRRWSAKNPDRVAFYNRRYQQTERGRINGRNRTQRWRERNLERIRADRREWYRANIDEARAYQRAYYAANRERFCELARQWREANREQVAAWSHTRRVLTNTGQIFTALDVESIFAEQDGRCTYCQADVTGCYEVDHFIAIAQGGGNEPENIVLSCMPCNRSKGAKMPWVWRPDLFNPPPL